MRGFFFLHGVLFEQQRGETNNSLRFIDVYCASFGTLVSEMLIDPLNFF